MKKRRRLLSGGGPLAQILGITVLMAACLIGPRSTRCAPGDLDPTFGQNGRVFTDVAVAGFTSFYPNVESVVAQPDGKILVCGRFWEDGISYWYGTFIVRYLPDGSLDMSFGNGGKVAVIPSGFPLGGPAVGAEMVLQADGSIVLIGSLPVANGIIVQRYSSAGVLDATFGNNGTSVVPASKYLYREGRSIRLQSDGKIVGAGWERVPDPNHDIVLFRMNADGSMDNGYGPLGNGTTYIDTGFDGAVVRLQPDGKVIVAGTLIAAPPAVDPYNLILARYNTDGSPDTSFGTNGQVKYRVGNSDSIAMALALQPDGKQLLLGYTTTGAKFIVRHTSGGSIDQTFGVNGVRSFDSNALSDVSDVFLQPDGKIVVTGSADAGASISGCALIRLLPGGAQDVSFGTAGRAIFTVNAGGVNYGYCSDSALLSNGKIALAGYFGNYYSDSHEKIALLKVQGLLAPTAAYVSISGRVLNTAQQGIAGARLVLTTTSGESVSTTTNSFGQYRFASVPAGSSFAISISSRGRSFTGSTRVITAYDNQSQVNFIARN